MAFKLHDETVVCRVPNLLTKKTAPAMLHFLHHLSQACYEDIQIFPGATADAVECAFNPVVLQALPKFRLRGVRFGRAEVEHWTQAGELSNLTVKMAFEMRIRYNLLYYYSYTYAGYEDLPQLLDFIANGRQLDKRLELEGYMCAEDINEIIKVGGATTADRALLAQSIVPIVQYFEGDVHSLEEAIRDVRYQNSEWRGWPERCPREAATQVTDRDDGTVCYRFDYINAHSGEPFSLLLGTRSHNECEGLQIVKFRLTFGSA